MRHPPQARRADPHALARAGLQCAAHLARHGTTAASMRHRDVSRRGLGPHPRSGGS
ncbi:hypothetical protein LG3211_5168 [Lysobacter gummosus]|nr:hypothetical protein LG3211_5168 [Lysobacter gummosus]